jgi:hypothetical protein
MQETPITFNTAKLAKEKGFENKTPHKLHRDYYNHLGELNGDVTEYVKALVKKQDTTIFNTIDAPTQSLLQKWLINNNIFANVELNDKSEWIATVTFIKENQKDSWNTDNDGYLFKSFEDAMEYALYESLINIV